MPIGKQLQNFNKDSDNENIENNEKSAMRTRNHCYRQNSTPMEIKLNSEIFQDIDTNKQTIIQDYISDKSE